jgi:hypothetical protein
MDKTKIFRFNQKRRSEPISKTNYDSDENVVEILDYNEEISSGWDADYEAAAPVQLKRPKTKNKSPSDRLHLAVWDNDAAKVQNLVLHEGKQD